MVVKYITVNLIIKKKCPWISSNLWAIGMHVNYKSWHTTLLINKTDFLKTKKKNKKMRDEN